MDRESKFFFARALSQTPRFVLSTYEKTVASSLAKYESCSARDRMVIKLNRCTLPIPMGLVVLAVSLQLFRVLWPS